MSCGVLMFVIHCLQYKLNFIGLQCTCYRHTLFGNEHITELPLSVVSVAVPSSTEPVGLNPFDDDEEEEDEMPAEQPNRSPVNAKKDEVISKTLVNRKHLFCCRACLSLSRLLLLPLYSLLSFSVLLVFFQVAAFFCMVALSIYCISIYTSCVCL